MNEPSFSLTDLEQSIKLLSNSIRKQDFLTYFKQFSLLWASKDSVTIGVVSSFHKDNLSKKFLQEIKDAITSIVPTIERVTIEVDENIEIRDESERIDCRAILKSSEKQTKKAQTQWIEVVKGISGRLISDRYQLSNFIVGTGSQLAHAACEAVARKPGSSYNPLYLYGNVGLGKTHLLQATANSIAKQHKNLKVVYTTADKFITDFVSGIQKRTADKLRNRYRQVDVLVIDDVQFFAGKQRTQEELYNIFNILYESGKQIVLSGDRPPRELTELEPRLKSRFEWGITVDIWEPDYETRLAILQEKAQSREFLLPQDVAEFIAENVTNNVRELEWILNQMIAEYDLRWTPPTLDTISMRLSKLAIKPLNESSGWPSARVFTGWFVSYEDLIQAVSNHFGIEIRALLSEDRRKENMIPRQVAMYLLKKKLNYTYERIGNIFSGRNHTAVMYSCKRLEQIMKKDQQIAYELNIIRDKLGI